MKAVHIANYAKPEEEVEILGRLSRKFALYDEVWLQKLVHNHPELILISEIYPGFDKLVPVVRELSLDCGRLDNLFVTPEGVFVLVEVKLWRNKESRKEVNSQIRRYGKDFAKLNYDDLNAKIMRISSYEDPAKDTLHQIVENFLGYGVDKYSFRKAVSSNLESHSFLLIILVDDIRSELLSLATEESVQQGIGVTEICFYQLLQQSLVAIPKVVARATLASDWLAVRSDNDARINGHPSSVTQAPLKRRASSDIKRLSLESFYHAVDHYRDGNSAVVRQFIDSLSDMNVVFDFPDRNLIIKKKFKDGKTKSLLSFYPKWIEFWQFFAAYESEEWRNLARSYMVNVTKCIPNSSIRQHTRDIDIKISNQYVPIESVKGRILEISALFRSALIDADRIILPHTPGI